MFSGNGFKECDACHFGIVLSSYVSIKCIELNVLIQYKSMVLLLQWNVQEVKQQNTFQSYIVGKEVN